MSEIYLKREHLKNKTTSGKNMFTLTSFEGLKKIASYGYHSNIFAIFLST